MSLTHSSEIALFENTQLQNTVEEEGFLRPLDSIQGIEHIGWYNNKEPVFRLANDSQLSSVGTDIVESVKSAEFDSAGLRAVVLPKDFTLEMCTDIFKNARIFIHIENWWESCIPNNLENEHEIKKYITNREQEISEQHKDQTSLATIAIEGHADIPINGQSIFNESYGQYQFVGWK